MSHTSPTSRKSGWHHIAEQLFGHGMEPWQLQDDGKYHFVSDMALNPLYFGGTLHLLLEDEVRKIFARLGVSAEVSTHTKGNQIQCDIAFPAVDLPKLQALLKADPQELDSTLRIVFPPLSSGVLER